MKLLSTILNFIFAAAFGLVKMVAVGLLNNNQTSNEREDLIEDPFKNDGQHDHSVPLADDGYKL